MSKVMRFDLNCQDIKIKEILNNKDFLKIEVWAISDAYPNNNNSHFPLNTMEVNINEGNFYNKPILGRWNSKNGAYEVHNSTVKYDPEYDNTYFDYEDGEVPIGVIRNTDDIKIVRKDGLNWIVFTAVLWVKYGYQGIKKILKSRKKKVSVEVSVFDSYIDENDIEIFKSWSFDGVTILGNLPNTKIPAHEGIENAHLTILEKLQEDKFSNQVRALQFAYQEFDKDNDIVIKEDNSSFNINNEEKEDKALALTYEQKRDLLETFLRENVTLDNEQECWIWVADLTEEYVFYCVSGEYYKTTYSIQEVETEGELPIVSINIAEACRVIRDWKSFEEDVEGIVTPDGSSENFNQDSEEKKPEEGNDNSEDQKKDEPEKKEHSEEDNNEGSEETKVEETKSDDSEVKDDQETECGKMSENQDDEQCKMDKDDDSEDVHDDDKCTCVLTFDDIEHEVSVEVFNYCNDIIAARNELQTNVDNVTVERDNLNSQLQEITKN